MFGILMQSNMQLKARLSNTHRNLRLFLTDIDISGDDMTAKHLIELIEYFANRPHEYENFIQSK